MNCFSRLAHQPVGNRHVFRGLRVELRTAIELAEGAERRETERAVKLDLQTALGIMRAFQRSLEDKP